MGAGVCAPEEKAAARITIAILGGAVMDSLRAIVLLTWATHLENRLLTQMGYSVIAPTQRQTVSRPTKWRYLG